MNGVECFIPQMTGDSVIGEIESLSKNDCFIGATIVPEASFRAVETLRDVSCAASANYIMLSASPYPVEMGLFALDRFIAVARDTGADMLYSDYYEIVSEEDGRRKHPLIDCQKGALRDDFEFGPILVFKTSAFRKAVESMNTDYVYGALYDLRLRMKHIVHINECLYTSVLYDKRKSGEKQFDYVDPRNREVQIEMEKICTEHLKRIGAYLGPDFKEPQLLSRPSSGAPFDYSIPDRTPERGFPVTASVIIPVYNRAKTIRDAVESALSQQCSFTFNVIVADNHSTDGTSDILEEIASQDNRLIHLVPERNDLCIGGCWNTAVHHTSCGEFAVQLDSDDVYSGTDTLEKMVSAFYQQQCAMVIGSYMMTDFDMNPIPPGVIDHREWTEENGRNNALRINGLGAPRAFWTPLLRSLNMPDVSYGEDYAIGLRISREYRIGRVWDVVYNCRRWGGNSDAALDVDRVNANNLYKDKIRTVELEARIAAVKNAAKRKKKLTTGHED